MQSATRHHIFTSIREITTRIMNKHHNEYRAIVAIHKLCYHVETQTQILGKGA